MQKTLILTTAAILLTASMVRAEDPPAKIDAETFNKIAMEAMTYRQTRLVDADRFAELLKEKNVILLDSRAESAFKNQHLKGAVHLSFSAFTRDKLAKVIPTKDTKILIYCNNNIEQPAPAFPLKMAPLALNIPTFINLYGYGYKNVYELSSTIKLSDERFPFVEREKSELEKALENLNRVNRVSQAR